MSDYEEWPNIDLSKDEGDPDYVPPENIKLLLDATQAALQSQIEGVRQMFSRLGTVLSQASALASGSAGVVCWLLTHPVNDRPAWLTIVFILAALLWSVSGGVAVIGMAGAKFGAPGIAPREGYKQEVLSQSVRDMQLWVIKSHSGTIFEGGKASDRLRWCLNTAITTLVVTPLICMIIVAIALST